MNSLLSMGNSHGHNTWMEWWYDQLICHNVVSVSNKKHILSSLKKELMWGIDRFGPGCFYLHLGRSYWIIIIYCGFRMANIQNLSFAIIVGSCLIPSTKNRWNFEDYIYKYTPSSNYIKIIQFVFWIDEIRSPTIGFGRSFLKSFLENKIRIFLLRLLGILLGIIENGK